MRFKNEKEFEFNVYKDLEAQGIHVQPLEKPFDSKIGNHYVEFKISKWNPIYHHPMIQFTKNQTVAMRKGKIPIVLVCGESNFYLLSKERVKKFINEPGRRNMKHVWISEKYFENTKMTYDQMIKSLKEILDETT